MWLSDRRSFLASFAALAGCGFTPVYGPQGGGSALLNRVALADPGSRNRYDFNSRFEERLGRGSGPYALDVRFETRTQGLGSLADGQTTRFRLLGQAFYILTEIGSETPLIEGDTHAFTSYSATGSTAATQAAERDARRRLMVILADQVIDRLLLDANTLPR